MKKFLIKIISSVISSLILMLIVTLIFLSIVSKKFPPDMRLVYEYGDNIVHAKENYKALLSKTKEQIETQIPDSENSFIRDSEEEQQQGYMKVYRSSNEQNKKEIEQIKARLSELEKQNKLILEKLKK